MKNQMLIVLAVAFGAAVSWLVKTPADMAGQADNEKAKQPLYWVAPMDPNFRRDGPGLSPMGMDLVPVYEEADTSSPGEVSISAAVESQMGVTAAVVQRLPWIEQQQAFAEIKLDNRYLWHFQIRADGWIERAYVSGEGERVTAGQKLFDFYSPDLVVAQEEFLVALADGEANLIASARERLQALNLPQHWINRLQKSKKIQEKIRFTAEQDATIIRWNLEQGRRIKAGEHLLTLSDLSHLWLEARLTKPLQRFNPQLADIQLIKPADKPLAVNFDKALLLPVLNSDRTQTLRIPLDNDQGAWRVGDYLNLAIRQQFAEVLQLPSQAVINDGIQPRVVLALGDGKFKSVAVTLGRETQLSAGAYPQKTEILAGLMPGDNVVTSGQFLLDSESSINSDLLRFYPQDESLMVPSQNQEQQPDIIWMQGKVKQSSIGNRIEVKHQGIKQWHWPAMQQDFHLALDSETVKHFNPDLNNWSQSLRIKLAALDDGDFCVVDIRPLVVNHNSGEVTP
ncbi:efflux RND transporter periplasmic adaptor subunit [Bacterioplanoides sp.]|uniref:efflux RND transporter periplasmic adaptor subunit n=1 Tax=Bacterioplanoides sp. TaxID=2066072 RepID=UPI003B5C9AB9